MQKWCPEPFDVGGDFVTSAAAVGTGFQTEEGPEGTSGDESAGRFRGEGGFVDNETLMAHLTREERAQVFELVELEVSTGYEQREEALKADLATQLAAAQAEHQTNLDGLTTALQQTVDTHLKNVAAGSAQLAVQLAEKIVRATVRIDREVLVRNLETTLFKIQGNGPVDVEVSPEDAEWLQQQPELCETLKLQTVNRDRRVETGGCIVHADNRTWDATLASQLETLAEVVEEMIATVEPDTTAQQPETPNEPGLD